MKLSETKISDIDEKKVIQGFILMAKEGMCQQDEILDKMDVVNRHLDERNSELADLQDADERLDIADEETTAKIVEQYGSVEEIRSKYKTLVKERNSWAHLLTQLEELQTSTKNFNKSLCFSNIRELLRQNPDVKIGQIEKEAGIRLGYMSRLEKEGNKSEPSMEFIVTAAKLLKVSLDTLVSVNLTGLTPTEQYIVNFFDKLKADTLADKLKWSRQTAFDLNDIEPDCDGNTWHPLFSEETFFEEDGTEYPDQVTRIVFNSKTFGYHTFISGDCFNLRLKNGTTLYLMDIEKSVHKTNDLNAKAIEAWVYVPNKDSQVLVASQDQTPVAPLVVTLFETVKERMEHPQINSDVMYAIDSFMKDDWSDDEESLPFN